MAVKSTKLGPGTLSLGPVATPVDFSCQLTGAVVAWNKDKADDITVLCGDVVAGGTTYSATLSGTFLQDLDDSAGIVGYSWQHKGESIEFTYTPNTAAGTSVSGTLIVDPIDVGSTDDYGSTMTSDFEWDCVGEPTLDFGTMTLAAGSSSSGKVGTSDPLAESVPA